MDAKEKIINDYWDKHFGGEDYFKCFNKFHFKESVLEIISLSQSYPKEEEKIKTNDLASWAIRNHWTYNFCDGLWWQPQESGNYIKKTTEELAKIISNPLIQTR